MVVFLWVFGPIPGGASAFAVSATITFSNGAEGMVGPSGSGGATFIEASGGNPGAHMHTVFNNFGITFFTTTNTSLIGDFTQNPIVTLAIDTKVEAIAFFGTPVSRPWLVELRDYDNPEPGYPYTSVWFKFADVAAATHGAWTSFSVTIEDTSAADLPAGWGGSGGEDPVTFEPILPPARTFSSVLAGVDELAFTTLQPGFFFGFTDFDVRIDNVRRTGGSPAGDIDGDGDVDAVDLTLLTRCIGGPDATTPAPGCSATHFEACDLDADRDVDLADFGAFAIAFTG